MVQRFPNTLRFGIADAEHADFPLVDSKGRKLGALIRIWPATITAGYDPDACERDRSGRGTDMPPGVSFQVNVQVTRNGAAWGPIQSSHTCPTIEAARAKGAELVAAARKRYAKQLAAKGAIK